MEDNFEKNLRKRPSEKEFDVLRRKGLNRLFPEDMLMIKLLKDTSTGPAAICSSAQIRNLNLEQDDRASGVLLQMVM
ncbi:hypothetical protein J4425_00905 [Candidatus Woesearchaeota archaeon]|nr:hypothetical protein [Candidatus Woesearchaeota archaeon]